LRRSRETNRGTTGSAGGVRLSGGSSLVFIDPASLRRSTAAAGAHDPHSTSTTASCLARAFGNYILQKKNKEKKKEKCLLAILTRIQTLTLI
jgi:E3 ubiquitin-protein ligase EDD1